MATNPLDVLDLFEDVSNDEPDAKRAKLSPKKVNNEQWDTMFERLVEYKDSHGDCLVPKRYSADPKLGTWVETQRVQYKRLQREVDESSGLEAVTPNKRLNQERLQKLESIGFAWTAKNVKKKPKKPEVIRKSRLNDSQWNEMYERLVAYKEQHGNTLVPRKYEPDQKLATWVETQRVLWNRDFREQKAAEWVAKRTEIPPSVAESHMSESQYVVAVATDALAAAAAEVAVEAINTQREDAAVACYNQLAAASQHHMPALSTNELADRESETMDVDTTLPVDEDDQKPSPAKRLTVERKEKLDEIGFVWSLRSKRVDDHWDEMFNQLLAYKAEHGDCLVPSRFEQNLKLGKWVETQRYEYTKLQRAATDKAYAKEVAAADAKAHEEALASGKPQATNPRLSEARVRRLEEIGFAWKVTNKMKKFYDKQWDQMFERLLQFKAETGHVMVPKRYPNDAKLGTWVHTQRIQYRKLQASKESAKKGKAASLEDVDSQSYVSGSSEGSSLAGVSLKPGEYRLTGERLKRLVAIGFVWSARDVDKSSEAGRLNRNSYDDQWDSMFQRLVDYKNQYGDCLVPKRFSADPKLGTWVDTQRVLYKKMQKKVAASTTSTDAADHEVVAAPSEQVVPGTASNSKPVASRLTASRINRLEDLGFVWSLRDDWQKHYDELLEFKRENGHCNVPARYAHNKRLGIWVSAQRQQYKIMQLPPEQRPKRSASLTPDRVDLLNKLGFTWTIRSRDVLGDNWNRRYQDLCDYKEQYGHCLVPSRYPTNQELGTWVGTQRTQYRLFMKAKETGKAAVPTSMNEERIKLLSDIGFIWALRRETGKSQHGDQMSIGDVAQMDDSLVPYPPTMPTVDHHGGSEPGHEVAPSVHESLEQVVDV